MTAKGRDSQGMLFESQGVSLKNRKNTVRMCPWLFALLLSVLLLTPALADSYVVRTTTEINGQSWVAANDYGDYTILLGGLNGPSYAPGICTYASNCYQTYYAATGQTVYSTFPPALAVDPAPIAGGGCTIDKSRFQVAKDLCVNGHEIVSGIYTFGGLNKQGVFAGNDPLSDFLAYGTLDAYLMTLNGNLFWIDGLNERTMIAINASASPVPEPSGLLLLGTGLLGVLTAARRKLRTS